MKAILHDPPILAPNLVSFGKVVLKVGSDSTAVALSASWMRTSFQSSTRWSIASRDPSHILVIRSSSSQVMNDPSTRSDNFSDATAQSLPEPVLCELGCRGLRGGYDFEIFCSRFQAGVDRERSPVAGDRARLISQLGKNVA
jgi:hypothetical protein